MKLDRPTAIWAAAATCAALVITICAVLRGTGHLGAWKFVSAFVIAIVLLLLLAGKLAAERPRLNLTIAAESIVALGIFSLILSLIVALNSMSDFVKEFSTRDLTIEDISRLTVPFMEGLG